MKKILVSLILSSSLLVVSQAQATTCDPTSDADASCGLKAAVEAKYGEGYCATLYEEQDGGATLEVYHRYTEASLDENGAGQFSMEVFPSFTDDNCSIKTTSALEGQDPTYRYYQGITLAATSDTSVTSGEEEFVVDLEPYQFEHTFTGLDFVEYQTRFDSNFYNADGSARYDSTQEQDYFSPAIPGLDKIGMKTDGTFTWEFPDSVDPDLMRADVLFYRLTGDGLTYTTFTSKYAPTESWEYYDWNNVDNGTYLLDGVTSLKKYYDDVLGYDGQVNHNIFNEHVLAVVTVKNHEVTDVQKVKNLDEAVATALDACLGKAEEAEDCGAVDKKDFADYVTPSAPKIKKASRAAGKISVQWKEVDGSDTYDVIFLDANGEKVSSKKDLKKHSVKINSGKSIVSVKVRACNQVGCSEYTKTEVD